MQLKFGIGSRRLADAVKQCMQREEIRMNERYLQ